SLIALMKAGSAGFEEFAAAIDSTTADEVAAQRLDNLAGDVEKFKGAVDSLNITFGNNFQGAARVFVQAATIVVEALTNLPPAVQSALAITVSFISVVLIIVGILGVFAGGILNIISLAYVLGPALTAVGTAFKTVAAGIVAMNAALAKNPLIFVLVILGTIVAALIALYAASESFRNAVQPLFDAILGVFTALAPIITNVLGVIGQFFSTL